MANNTMHRDAEMPPPEAADRLAMRIRRKAVRTVRKIVLGATVLIVVAWSVTAVALWRDYTVALHRGAWVGANLASAFAVELTLTLDAAEQTFRALQAVEPVTAAQDLGPVEAAFRQTAATLGDPDAALVLFSADGKRVAAFGQVPDRLDEAALARICHGPSENQAGLLALDAKAGWLAIQRVLRTSGGAVAGRVALLLSPAHLLRLSRSGGINAAGQVFILRNDGAVVVGYGPGEASGMLLAGGSLRGPGYRVLLRAGETTSYRQFGADGVERLITVRQLDSAPLRIAVTRPLGDIVGYERQRVWFFAIARMMATILIGSLTLLLTREVFRRSRREIELLSERARLEAINSELEASQRDLDAANHVRAQFLAHMSHELRTPLHAIIGFAELIRDRAPALPLAPSAEQVSIQEYAADIWSSGRHLLALINSILEIAKSESGSVTLREEPVSIANLMDYSLSAVRDQATTASIVLEMTPPNPGLTVIADPTKLLQVLINLLSNAVKFTPKGGRVTYDVACRPDGDLVFTIADTGIGMTEAEIDIALQPFGQVDNTAARRFEGTGLGLPIARRLTELHGGRLDIVSTKGRGTTVTVTLPARRVQADGVQESQRASEGTA